MKRKWTLLISAIIGTAMVAGACSQKEEKPTFTGDKTEQPAYQAQLNAISPSAYDNVDGLNLEPGTYISIIGKDSNSSYWKEIKRGVNQAAEDLNKELGYKGDDKVKVVYSAPTNGEEIDEQVNILDEELARYPDALGIASIDEQACKVQFDLATENSIPLIALDSGNTYSGLQCTVKTDNAEAARTGAYKLCDEIEDSGEIILLVHDSESSTSKERESSFKQEIAEGHPEVKIVETIYLDEMADMKKKIVEEKNKNKKETAKEITVESLTDADVIQYYLDKHANVKGCFGTNAAATQLAVSVSESAEQELMIVGFDAGKEQMEALEAGIIKGLVVQNPFGIGYASVIAAARTVLQSGNEAVVDTGYIWVTKDNMKEVSIKSMLYE